MIRKCRIYSSLYAIRLYFDGFYPHYMQKRKAIMFLIYNVAYKQQKPLFCI